jgi:hypothetical protein
MSEQTDEGGSGRTGHHDGKSEAADKDLDRTLRELLKMYAECAKGGPSPAADAMSQALLMILGSGPAFAAFGSLLAANRADGMMYYNAVFNQQKTNLISMAVTAKCVKYMLNVTPGLDDDDLLDEAVEDALDEDG